MARGSSRNSYSSSQPASLGWAMGFGCRRAAARAMWAMRERTNSKKTPQRQDTRLPATTLATTLAMASCGRSSGRGSGVGLGAAVSYHHGLRFPRAAVSTGWAVCTNGRRRRSQQKRSMAPDGQAQAAVYIAQAPNVTRLCQVLFREPRPIQCTVCQPRNWLTLSSSQRSQRSQRSQGSPLQRSRSRTRRRLLRPL